MTTTMFCMLLQAFCGSLGQFLFLKNQMIGWGHRMSHWSTWDNSHGSEGMYIRPNFAFSFPVDLSAQVILPYDRTTITSSTFIGLAQFPWHFETDFGKFVGWCNSNSFSAVAAGSLNEIVDDVVQCWLLPEVLFSMRSTTMSGSVVFLSMCW